MDGITSFGGMNLLRYAMREAGLETRPESGQASHAHAATDTVELPQNEQPARRELLDLDCFWEPADPAADIAENTPDTDTQPYERLQIHNPQPSGLHAANASHVPAYAAERSRSNPGNRRDGFAVAERAVPPESAPAAAPSSINPGASGRGRGQKRTRPRGRDDYNRVRAAVVAANAARYASIIAAGTATCAAAKAATEAFGRDLRAKLRTFIAGDDAGLGLEIIGLHNMGEQLPCEGRRIRLTFKQETEQSPIQTTVELIDPDRSVPEISRLTSTYKIPQLAKARQKLIGKILFRAAKAARTLCQAPPDRPAAGTPVIDLTERRYRKASVFPGMTEEQIIRSMHSFKPILGNGVGSRIARDEVTNGRMLFQAWLEVCATEINVVEKIYLRDDAPAYVMSVSGLAGRKDQPMPDAFDKNGLHCHFRSEPDGYGRHDIKLLVFANPTGHCMEALGEAVLPEKASHMSEGVNISTLMTWAVVVIRALKSVDEPPTGLTRANMVKDLQAKMICAPEWKVFGDADLVMAFYDFKPVRGATVPNYSRSPGIVSASRQALANRSPGGDSPSDMRWLSIAQARGAVPGSSRLPAEAGQTARSSHAGIEPYSKKRKQK